MCHCAVGSANTFIVLKGKIMNIPLISQLVDGLGFELLSWKDRYGKGTWLVCLPNDSYEPHEIWEASEDADFPMFLASEYLLSTTANWLPVVTGNSLSEATNELESRLRNLDETELSHNSNWMTAVKGALAHFCHVRRKQALNNGARGSFLKLPSDYSIVAKAYKGNMDFVWDNNI